MRMIIILLTQHTLVTLCMFLSIAMQLWFVGCNSIQCRYSTIHGIGHYRLLFGQNSISSDADAYHK